MSAAVDQAKSIFLHAGEIAAGEERRAYVAGVCGADTGLRHEVEALLSHTAGWDRSWKLAVSMPPPGRYGPASARSRSRGPARP